MGPVPSAQVIQRLNWLSTGDLTHLLAVCCTEALVSSHVHLQWGCLPVLTTRQLASSRVTSPRDSKVEATMCGLLGLTEERGHEDSIFHHQQWAATCWSLGVHVSGRAPGPFGRLPFRSCIVLFGKSAGWAQNANQNLCLLVLVLFPFSLA